MAELIGAYEVAGKILRVAHHVGKTTLGYVVEHIQPGAWGELGGKYGEAVGGLKPHPASLQFYSTPEQEPGAEAKEASQ